MISHNYITASKAAAAIVTLLLLLTVGGGDLYSASAINYSSSSKQQLRHSRQNTPAAKKTATTTQEQRGLNSYNNDDGYDTNSIFKTEKDTKCTRSITNHNHGRNCIMTCQTTAFVYTHDDILLDKTVSEHERMCTYDEEEIMVESDEGSSTHEDEDHDGLEFDVWRGGGKDDSWKCSTKKRSWQVSNMREGVGVLRCCFISTLVLKNTCFLKYTLYLEHRVQHSRKMKILHGQVHLPRR